MVHLSHRKSPIHTIEPGPPYTGQLCRPWETLAAAAEPLLDFKVLFADLAKRPTHVADELVHGEPDLVQFVDAAKQGALWADPPNSANRLDCPISSQPPSSGCLPVQEPRRGYELVAVVLGQMALGQVTSLWHTHCLTFSDNTPTVSWASKMAFKAQTNVAYNLLRGLLAMFQCTTCSVPP
jgi:hypothetical protein